MAISYQELIYSAINNALRGVDPQPSPSVDATMIAETLFPIVSQSVSEAAAANEYKRSLLRRQKSITLAAGQATLSDDVLTHYIADSTLIDPATLTKKYAWRDYPQFIRSSDRRLGKYTLVGGDTLQVVEPNASFTVPLTASGARTLTIPCVVVKPAAATDPVDCPDEIASDLMEALSEALRGQLAKMAGEAA